MTSETSAINYEPTIADALPVDLPWQGAWKNWTFWFGPLVSLAILGATVLAIGRFDTEPVLSMLPTSPGFWLLFAFSYLLTPMSEYVIFRRLWALPAEGIGALMRKRLSNELLLGYLGEVYFYSWARQHGSVTNTPFGAIKDVAILSALAGNLVTLLLLVPALPLFARYSDMMDTHLLFWSVLIVGFTSLVALVARRKLFSLPESERRFVLKVHLARVVGNLALSAVLWHIALPNVELGWWFLLVTLRQLISRLPLIPNKDVVFAGLAVLFIGRNVEISSLMALMAGLILACHLATGLYFGASDLVRRVRKL